MSYYDDVVPFAELSQLKLIDSTEVFAGDYCLELAVLMFTTLSGRTCEVLSP
jgi:hypothetical protein